VTFTCVYLTVDSDIGKFECCALESKLNGKRNFAYVYSHCDYRNWPFWVHGIGATLFFQMHALAGNFMLPFIPDVLSHLRIYSLRENLELNCQNLRCVI
jgi:hypothetical protein